jgi:NAD(P)H-dependent flavin oxidoreductase YrpB (nitropropane dioxygenase family)
MRTRFIRSTEIEQDQLEAVMASDVDLFACGIGAPRAAVERAKELGKTTAALIGSPRHVRRALASGVDIIVAQGGEAGAHTGTIGTFTLVPQIVDACGDIPVLAAGGVATGRHVAAALTMGAAGVWAGTIWLTTTEHAAHMAPALVDKLLGASSADTVVSRSESGKTFRQIRSAWSDEWAADDAPEPLRMPYQDVLVGDLLGAIDEHEVEPLLHSGAGQGIGYADSIRPVATVMEELVADAEAALSGFSDQAGSRPSQQAG